MKHFRMLVYLLENQKEGEKPLGSWEKLRLCSFGILPMPRMTNGQPDTSLHQKATWFILHSCRSAPTGLSLCTVCEKWELIAREHIICTDCAHVCDYRCPHRMFHGAKCSDERFDSASKNKLAINAHVFLSKTGFLQDTVRGFSSQTHRHAHTESWCSVSQQNAGFGHIAAESPGLHLLLWYYKDTVFERWMRWSLVWSLPGSGFAE